MFRFILLTIIILRQHVHSEDSVGTARDSYIDAFKATHTLNQHMASKSDQASFFPEYHPVYKQQEEYGPPKDTYGPPKDNYGPPREVYGPPKDVYGPPKDNYGPPKDTYGAPQNGLEHHQEVYGPPKVMPVYGPPSYSYGPPIVEHGYGMPSLALGLLEKFKFKLDLFTLGKIVLKLVIFKKIVSLIAILCLLLFIPSLKHKQENDDADADDEMRNFKENSVDERINNVSAFVLDAINSFNGRYDKKDCNGLYCKSKEFTKYLDRKLSYKKLVGLYSQDSQEIVAHAT